MLAAAAVAAAAVLFEDFDPRVEVLVVGGGDWGAAGFGARLERPPHLPPSGLAPPFDCVASRTVTFSLTDSADPIAAS